jgi:hypothetical protein
MSASVAIPTTIHPRSAAKTDPRTVSAGFRRGLEATMVITAALLFAMWAIHAASIGADSRPVAPRPMGPPPIVVPPSSMVPPRESRGCDSEVVVDAAPWPSPAPAPEPTEPLVATTAGPTITAPVSAGSPSPWACPAMLPAR